MPTFNEFIAAGVDMVFTGVNDSTGYLQGGTATPPANGAPAGSGMARARGAVSADPTIQEPDIVNVPGDNRTQGSFIFEPDAPPSFTFGNTVFNLTRLALQNGSNTYADGDINSALVDPESPTRHDFCWILQSPAKKKDILLEGVKAWMGYMILSSQVTPLGRAAFSTKEAAQNNTRVVANRASVRPDGLDLLTGYGKRAGSIIELASDYPLYMHHWRGDSTEDEFTLPYEVPAPTNGNKIRIRVDGTAQTIVTDYTVTVAAGITTIKFESGSIPAAGEKVVFFGEILPS